MNDIRIEKIIDIGLIMYKLNYKITEITSRRINHFHFEANTIITHNNEQIKISTETAIKGVYNILLLFPDGTSKLDFEIK